MKTEIKINVRAYPVELKDNRTGEKFNDTIVLTKELLHAAGLLGLGDEDIIYRIYNRRGYKVTSIASPDKREIKLDLCELYHSYTDHGLRSIEDQGR